MRVLAHHSDRQLIGDPVIDAQADSAGREVVTFCIRIGVHTDKVTESSHPHAPAVFRPGLEDRFYDTLEDFPSTSALSSRFTVAPLTFMLELNPVDPLWRSSIRPSRFNL